MSITYYELSQFNNKITTSTNNRIVASMHYEEGGVYDITLSLNGEVLSEFNVDADKYTDEREAIVDIWDQFSREYPEYKNRKPIVLTHWDD